MTKKTNTTTKAVIALNADTFQTMFEKVFSITCTAQDVTIHADFTDRTDDEKNAFQTYFNGLNDDTKKILRNSLVSRAKKAYKVFTEKQFDTLQRKLFNSRYTITFQSCNDYFSGQVTAALPMIEFMNDEQKDTYNAKTLVLMQIFADMVKANTEKFPDYIPAIKKQFSVIGELFSNEKAPVNLRINNKDVNTLIQSSVKTSKDKKGFSTLGEKQEQAVIETLLFNKLQGNDYAVTIYSRDKNFNGSVPSALDLNTL